MLIGTSGHDRFTLPAEAATQTFAILAKRGVGKTYTAAVMAEGMLEANIPVVIFDPLDVWWGLRSSRTGKRSGFPVVIFGGERGDLPLNEHAAKMIADLIVDDNISCVLSTRHMRKNEQRRFITDFAEHLYHRKGESRHRTPLHLFIDEADSFCPQRVMKGYERMLGAMEDLVRRGRASGLGVTMITQRPASINKEVLTQAEVLVALRIVSPQDRKAIGAWIEEHDAHGQRDEFMRSLASLPVGTAWFWSPGWLGIFKKVKVRERNTFDSSATPKMGRKLKPPKKLAAVDLKMLREKLSEVVKKAQEEDPKLLKKRIRELETEMKRRDGGSALRQGLVTNDFKKRLEAEAAKIREHYRLTRLQELRAMEQKASHILGGLEKATGSVQGFVDELSRSRKHDISPPEPSAPLQRPAVPTRISPKPSGSDSQDNGLAKCPRAMLMVLAQRYPESTSRPQLSLLSGYKLRSSTFRNGLSSLRIAGYALTPSSGAVIATETGLKMLGPVDSMPTGRELQEYWIRKVKRCAGAMLQVLIDAYPDKLSKLGLSRKSGYSLESSTFRNGMSTLRRVQLIRETEGMVEASENLF